MEHHLSRLAVEFETRFFAHLVAGGRIKTAPSQLAGGRSNHVWRAGDRVLKLYDTVRPNPLFSNDPQRESASLTALEGSGLAPHLMATGVFEEHSWLTYGHITGAPWQADTSQVARALGRLHRYPSFGQLAKGRNGSVALTAQTLDILALCHDSSELRNLAPVGGVAPLANPVLIHGDPVPGNLLVQDGKLTLIDWQCPQLGDPAEDLALFLSPAMQLLYRGAPLSQEEECAFLAAYPDPQVVARMQVLRPWFHWRMAAYCLWKAQQGNRCDRAAMVLEQRALQSINPRAA